VTIGKNKVLVYELHLTNFDVVPLTVKRISIFAAHDDPGPLTTLEGEKLSAAMIRIGAPTMMSGSSSGGSGNTRTLDPGGRNVVFLWIELPANQSVPANLRHQLVFSSTPTGTDKPRDATLEDFVVPVNQDPALMLSPPFDGGIWLAGNGPANDSDHRRGLFAIDGQIYSPERFAIDWVKVGPNGDTRHDGTSKNENWWGWGEPVLAVADGEITEIVDEFPDNTPRVLPPVTLDNIAGNHIVLEDTWSMTDWFARPVLHVKDVEASLRFYVDRLGFTSPWRYDEDGRAHVAQVDRQGCALILADTWPEKIGKGLMFISLNVEPATREAAVAALDALRAELEAKGVPVKEGSWGYRLLVVDDLDGNQLFFNYPARLHPARLLEIMNLVRGVLGIAPGFLRRALGLVDHTFVGQLLAAHSFSNALLHFSHCLSDLASYLIFIHF
jgi:catechol 2,3-dioxygenase-like lactoylglutathione lyase family enzyme